MNVVPLHAAPTRPAPVVLATLLAGAYAAHSAYLATSGLLDRSASALVPLLELGVWGLLLAGLWRGRHLAYVLVTIAATLTVLAAAPAFGESHHWADAIRLALGVALLVVLLFPQTSRTYYARRR